MPPRDYKRPLAEPRARQPWPAWAMLGAGVLLGLFIAFLVYLAGLPPETEVPELSLPKLSVPAPTPKAAPAPTQPAKAPSKPKFEFYTILPELEVLVPEPDPVPQGPAATAPNADPAAQPQTPMRGGESYFLQAGSFRSTAEADRMKASLTLLGLDVVIQTVSVDGTQWHRVRVGPFTNARSLNAARGRLRDNHIEFMTLKASAPG